MPAAKTKPAKRKPKPTAQPAGWRNRIIGHGEESPERLLANEKNWRIHPFTQQQSLTGVLDEVGYVQAVIVNKRLNKSWPAGQRGVETLVDGHMRVEAAISKGQARVPVVYVDLTPAEEAKILASFDPISGLAAIDSQKLDDLLRDVATGSEALAQMFTQLLPFDLGEPPASVKDNAAEIAEIAAQRRKGNANTAEKNDTEKYLVVVFGSREAKEAKLKELGLPADERYVSSSAMVLTAHAAARPLTAAGGREIKSASPKKSGAGG